jgi:hypothetical protein
MKGTCTFLLITITLLFVFNASCFSGAIEAQQRESDVPPSGYVMKFVRKGGYFGWHDEFWIYPDGRVLNSAGKTARIRTDLVTKWMEIISPVAVPVSKKTPFLGPMGWDCYMYGITVYEKGEAKTLSLICTDAYIFDKEGEISVIDIGPIRDTLMSLSWE